MSNKPVFLGLPNHVSQPYATIAGSALAGLFPTDMGPSWLQTEEPTDRTRWTLLDPYHTQVAVGTSGIPSRFDGISLINHNIADGGQIRFIGNLTGPSLNLPTRVAPSSITATTNVTGSVGDIDEAIDAPDGSAIVPTVTSDSWGFRCEFPTPVGPISSHAGSLCFVVRASRAFVGAGATSPTTYPGFGASLTEAGSLIRNLGNRAVTTESAGGQLLIFPFNVDELADTTGAGIGLELSGWSGTSASGHQYAKIEAVSLYWEGGPGGEDSGWITIDYGDPTPAPLTPTRDVDYLPDTPWENIIGLTMLIRSDQTRHSPPKPSGGGVPVGAIRLPDSFVQAGVLCAGEGIRPARGIKRGSGPLAGPETAGFSGVTATGQSYGSDAYRFRSTDPIELMVSRAEAVLLQDQLAYRRGQQGAFYVSLEPSVEMQYRKFSAFWATLKSISRPHPLGRYRADGEMLFSIDVQLVEKL